MEKHNTILGSYDNIIKLLKRIMDWFGTEASCPVCGTMIYQKYNGAKKCAYCGAIYINNKKLIKKGD